MSCVVSTNNNNIINYSYDELFTQFPIDTALKHKQCTEVEKLFLQVFPNPETHIEVRPQIYSTQKLEEIRQEKQKQIEVLTDALSQATLKVLKFYQARLEWEINEHLPSELKANEPSIAILEAESKKCCDEETEIAEQRSEIYKRQIDLEQAKILDLLNESEELERKELEAQMEQVESELEDKKNKSNVAFQNFQACLNKQQTLTTEKKSLRIRLQNVNFILSHAAALEKITSIFKTFLDKYSIEHRNYFGCKAKRDEAATKFSHYCAYSDYQSPTYYSEQTQLLENYKYWHQSFDSTCHSLKSKVFPTVEALTEGSMFSENFR
jgi:hypothetical protein